MRLVPLLSVSLALLGVSGIPAAAGAVRGAGICGRRRDRNADRSSVVNSSGSSQAAKWPPRSTRLK